MRGLFLFFFVAMLSTTAIAAGGAKISAEQATEKAVRMYADEAAKTSSGRVPGATKVVFNDNRWVVFVVDKVPKTGAHKTYYFSPSGELLRTVP